MRKFIISLCLALTYSNLTFADHTNWNNDWQSVAPRSGTYLSKTKACRALIHLDTKNSKLYVDYIKGPRKNSSCRLAGKTYVFNCDANSLEGSTEYRGKYGSVKIISPHKIKLQSPGYRAVIYTWHPDSN